MKGFGKKLLSVLIALFMAFNLLNVSAFAVENEGEEPAQEGTELTLEKVEDDSKYRELVWNRQPADFEEEDDTVGSKLVRVSIFLNRASMMDVGFDASELSEDALARAYKKRLEDNQKAMEQKISKEVLGGEELDVVWNLTVVGNIISAYVPADKIDEISALPGVKYVTREIQYAPAVTETPADPQMTNSSAMTNTTLAWANGYTGAGSLIAVIDTGIDDDHRSFDGDAYDYAIAKVNETRKENGLEEIVPMSADDVAKVWDNLNIAKYVAKGDNDFYLSSKTPFAVNYVDANYDITHDHDKQSEHGSHVAGIAAANRYVKENGDFVNALDAVLTQGEAPDAQLLVMKVFGTGGGAYPSDYFAAIEDAMMLGADSINLSLGSSVAGEANDYEFDAMLNKMAKSDSVVSISMGNNGSWADETAFGYLYGEHSNLMTGGNPGSYTNAFTVASVDNDGITSMYIKVGENMVFWTENNDYGNGPFAALSGTQEFVMLPIGQAGNEEEAFAAVADVLNGKVAVCYRGSTSFFQKANAAVKNGAAAVVIVNNQPGTIGLNLTGYEYTAPVVSILQADGELLKAAGEEVKDEEGNTLYWKGSFDVVGKPEVQTYNSDYYTMSSFSSWGVPGNLSLKPEITAPGGNIYSVNGLVQGGQAYENMSGTSMAAPQIAGITAVVKQYIRDNDLMNSEMVKESGLTERQLVQSLLMSTADPLVEEDSGNYYSVQKQGAGLVNTDNAVNSKSFIVMGDEGLALKAYEKAANDGKVKAELGEDAERKGEYDVNFTLYNLTDKDILYTLGGDFFTQDFFMDSRVGLTFRDTWTVPLNATLEWKVNGETVKQDETLLDYDFNGDGVYNELDAQHLLDHAVKETEINKNADKADLDKDGDVDTYDAYLALKHWNEADTLLPANGKTEVSVHITLLDIKDYDWNGAFVEGFLYAEETASEDGGLGIKHSIPVLGFYGNWTEASMTDIGSYEEYYLSGKETRPPYMYAQLGAKALEVKGFFYADAGSADAYLIGGNPMQEEEYKPERNAIPGDSTVLSARFSLIRNASAAKVFVNADSEEVFGGESLSTLYAAYYYDHDAEWRNTTATANFNYSPSELKDGTKLTLGVSLAPEYYTEDGTMDWSKTAEGSTFTMDVLVDTEAPVITQVTQQEDEETGKKTLVLKATDNQYLAGVALLNPLAETEDEMIVTIAPSSTNTEFGADETYTLPLDEEISYYLIMAMDYAGQTATYKVTTVESEEDPYVVLDQYELLLVAGNSAQINASVMPWGIDPVDEVTWTSADEAVATVNADGVVTAVNEGETTVTATSVKFPEASASATVKVVKIDKDLKGILWDENGKVWFNEFNLKNLPEYGKLNTAEINDAIASTAIEADGTMYVTTMDGDLQEGLSNLYKVDPSNDYELTLIGESDEVPYLDIAPAPNKLGNDLIAVYGPYIIWFSKDTGAITAAAEPDAEVLQGNLIGVTYDEGYEYPGYGTFDCYYFLDDQGNIYSSGYLFIDDTNYYGFSFTRVASLGYSTDTPCWQGFYYDGSAFYWSRYVEANNYVDVLMLDAETGELFNTGKFADNVWPVGGLYDDKAAERVGTASVPAEPGEKEVELYQVLPREELERVDFKATRNEPAGGSLNAIRSQVSAKSECETTDDDKLVKEEGATQGTVKLEAELGEGEDKAHNGKYVVTWNPEEVELVGGEEGVRSKVKYDSYTVDLEKGEVVFGYIDEEGFEEGKVVAELSFKLKEGTDVSYVDVEQNEAANENPETAEKYKLGSEMGEETIAPAYELTVEDGEHGKTVVEPDDEYYGEGEEVTLTFEPEDGYEVDEVLVNGEAAEVGEDGTLTFKVDGKTSVKVTYKASEYKFIEGMGQTWTKGSKDGAFFKTDGAFSIFAGLYVDGELLTPDQYEAKEGSTEITLKAEYLETLAEGEHTLTAQYGNGSEPETTFKVAKKSEQPGTGMKGMSSLWYVLAGLGAAAFVVLRKKEETEE